MTDKERQELMAKSMKQAVEMLDMMNNLEELVRQSFDRQNKNTQPKKEEK